MNIIAFKVALAIYFLSTLGYIVSMYSRKVFWAKMGTWILTVAFLNHTIFFILRCAETRQVPVVSLHEAIALFAWTITGAYLAFQLKTKTRTLGIFVSPVAFLLMILASAGLGGKVIIPSALQGNLVPVHVVLAVLGEALFALASLSGAMYLIQEGRIKHRITGRLTSILPSLTDLDKINHISLSLGFPLLTLGILAGSIWAQTVWGSLWQWDPKQLWTLSVWIFYALILHQRLAIGWKGRKAALFSFLAFVFLLLSYMIVTLFLVTVHTFI
jgi:cytochrome c-type biogenesis protein CcsB